MIELRNVSFAVEENGLTRSILDNVSIVFKDNCVTAITGHNGSGKSTLTKLIMGILRPTSGRIFFDGVDITDMSITERAKMGISYAFQQPVTFKGITVKDLIDIASGESNSISRACEYLSRVGLCAKDYIDRSFDKTLSGGELKRIELALTLAKSSRVVIFDEPEAGVDLWSFDKLNALFEKDKTYIVVSHQTRLLERADEIVVLDKGKVSQSGKSKNVLKNMNRLTCSRVGGEDEIR